MEEKDRDKLVKERVEEKLWKERIHVHQISQFLEFGGSHKRFEITMGHMEDI
ncbi:hypothetical protein A2U01_0070224, partial [Trifolium medium]|nr:hypothetical protein [Trifolium medium]